LLWNVVFYFGLVGVIEELLFRGLIYRALEDWRGVRWAIWGSAVAFGVYHVGWQGLLGGLATAVVGLWFAVIRWRTGGILGLILIHGLLDTLAVELWGEISSGQVLQGRIVRPGLALLTEILAWGMLIFLWKFYPQRLMTRKE
jgi:hypothetical protein